MKLTYRGISYEYNPVVVETTTGQVGGKYRGLDWRFRNLKKPPILAPRFNLTYRGVTYNQADIVNQEPGVSMADKARALMTDKTKNAKKRQQSLLSRTAAEIN
jgi:Domain of unknown function (DUF4278)